MIDIDNILLKSLENDVKRAKKNIKWIIFLISFNISFIILYTFLSFVNFSLMNILFVILWVIISYTNISTFKSLKKSLFSLENEYYTYLKKVDYPKYIKQQRNKKLKKIKRLFH